MRTGRPKSRKEPPLPDYWLSRLTVLAEERYGSLEEFCATPPRISNRSLQRYCYKEGNQIPVKQFVRIGWKLGLSSEELRNELAGRTRKPLAALTAEADHEAEEIFRAYQTAGLYDRSGEHASAILERARVAGDVRLEVWWLCRIASAARTRGDLRVASTYYADALAALEVARKTGPLAPDLLVSEGRIRFGQALNDDYLIRGHFAAADKTYAALERAVKELSAQPSFRSYLPELRYGALHLRRQRAEMARHLGRYHDAAALSRAVRAEYGDEAHEARWWAGLGEADAYRLLNQLEDAERLYRDLIDQARNLGPTAKGRLGSALLRLGRVAQVRDDVASAAAALDDAAKIAARTQHRYRLLTLYAALQRASGRGTNPVEAKAHLEFARQFGDLSATYTVLEYGHAWLCQGELHRARGPTKRAAAVAAFTTALSAYRSTGGPWGIVRAWIGIALTGTPPSPFPLESSTLEGLDQDLWMRFSDGTPIPHGVLSMNLP